MCEQQRRLEVELLAEELAAERQVESATAIADTEVGRAVDARLERLVDERRVLGRRLAHSELCVTLGELVGSDHVDERDDVVDVLRIDGDHDRAEELLVRRAEQFGSRRRACGRVGELVGLSARRHARGAAGQGVEERRLESTLGEQLVVLAGGFGRPGRDPPRLHRAVVELGDGGVGAGLIVGNGARRQGRTS